METSPEQFKEFIARRLLTTAEDGVKQSPKPVVNQSELEPLAVTALQSSDFIKIEKNLTSLAFFTPSNKRVPGTKKKTIVFTKIIDGKKIEARATILPSAEYGLPITADQDTYFALLKLTTEMHRRQGRVTNPIGFTSAEILRLQGKSAVSGFHYKELIEQLLRIKTTTILSEGAVYLAGKKVWAKDAFNVLDRVVFFGHQLEDGSVADRNYVWFSEWQLENINHNHLLPLDHETYKQLRTHIAKALQPLLQIWLFATREEKSFEKRYDELCQLLNIRPYPYLSKIKEKLGPSLDELKTHGYLSDWRIERTADKKAYKIVFYHGDKFHRDRRRRLEQKDQRGTPTRDLLEVVSEEPGKGIDQTLFNALTSRGITEAQARKLLQKVPPDQHVLDQLEWGDSVIAKEPTKIQNPPGFYIHLVKENLTPPAKFETSRKRKLRAEAAQAQREQHEEEARLMLAYEAYEDYISAETDNYIANNPLRFQEILAAKTEQIKQHKNLRLWDGDTITKLATPAARSELAKGITLDTFEYFSERYKAQQPPVSQTASQLIQSKAGQGSSTPKSSDEEYLTV